MARRTGRTLASLWESFARDVTHPDADEAWRRADQIAFYCGAAGVLGIIGDLAGDDTATEETVRFVLAMLDAEKREFQAGLASGPHEERRHA